MIIELSLVQFAQSTSLISEQNCILNGRKRIEMAWKSLEFSLQRKQLSVRGISTFGNVLVRRSKQTIIQSEREFGIT